MQKIRTKNNRIYLIPLSIFYETLEVKRIRIKKRQTYHLKMTLKSNYFLDMTVIQKENQALASENLIFKMRFDEERS